MSDRNRDVEKPLRARLVWAGCGAARGSLLARLIARAQIQALTPWQRLLAAWPALAMEFLQPHWPAVGSESRQAEAATGRATTILWKVVERDSSARRSILAPPQVRREVMQDEAPVTRAAETSTPAVPEVLPGDAHERLDWRPPTARLEHLARPGALRLESAPASVALPYLPTANDEGEEGSTNPQSPYARREVLPAFSPAPESPTVPDPSAIDRLFSNPELAAASGGLTFRVLPPEAPADSPPASAPASPWYTTPAPSQPAAGLQPRFSRADIDLLTSRVMAQIRREQRLERESKGLL